MAPLSRNPFTGKRSLDKDMNVRTSIVFLLGFLHAASCVLVFGRPKHFKGEAGWSVLLKPFWSTGSVLSRARVEKLFTELLTTSYDQSVHSGDPQWGSW